MGRGVGSGGSEGGNGFGEEGGERRVFSIDGRDYFSRDWKGGKQSGGNGAEVARRLPEIILIMLEALL